MMEKPLGTEQNNCRCESSRPFMGRIKVNGKPCCSSSLLSKRNAGERCRGRQKRLGMQWDSARRAPRVRLVRTRGPHLMRKQSVFGHH